MLRLRQYKEADAEIIEQWVQDKDTFMKWGGELFGEFPINGDIIDDVYRNIVFFISCVKGNIYPKRSLCFINPLAIMIICVILSKLLPQTFFVNGVVSMGQQSIGFFIVFLALLITCGNLRGGE